MLYNKVNIEGKCIAYDITNINKAEKDEPRWRFCVHWMKVGMRIFVQLNQFYSFINRK